MIKPKGTSQCWCDCMIGTCSDCFIKGYIKPYCTNCREDFNNGVCNCDEPKPHIMKGWVDNTKIIVNHTPEEKIIIKGWIDEHNNMLKKSSDFYNTVWQTKTCECGKDFSCRGGKVELCKLCTLKILNDNDKYKETDLKGAHRNF